MQPIEDIPAARRALRVYLATADQELEPDTFNRLETLVDSPSPVDQIVLSAELLYARRDDIDDAGRVLVAQLASFAAVNAWHGMATENRGGRIMQAMLRDVGEEPAPGQPPFPAREDDPEPNRAYVVEPTPDPAPPPAGA